MNTPRTCLQCGCDISHMHSDAKFCKPGHRSAYNQKQARKNKSLGGGPEIFPGFTTAAQTEMPVLAAPLPATPKPVPQVDTQKLNRISNQLNSSDQLVFKLLMDQNKDLKDDLKTATKEHAVEMKELNGKIDTLMRDKAALEKNLADVERQLGDKPKGLSGFLSQNPETVKSTILEGLPLLVDVLKTIKGESSTNLPPFVQFLYKQPEDVQRNFMTIMQTIMANEQEFPVHVQNITRGLMAPAGEAQKQVSGTGGRYS